MGLLDFLFGSEEHGSTEDFRSVHEERRHRARGSGNWTSHEDWDCDPVDHDHDSMDGFDSYEDNDF